MAKQTYKIESFHGGLNSNADPRDIKDNEASKLQNVKISKLGRLKPVGSWGTDNIGTLSNPLKNRGLTTMKSDKRFDGTDSNETFVIVYDTDDNAIDIKDSTSWNDNIITSIDTNHPVYYVGDGNLRVGDGEFKSGTSNKWFGYINEHRFSSLNAGSGQPQITKITCVADSSNSLNQKWFDIYGGNGAGGQQKNQVWIDINDNESSPTGGTVGGYGSGDIIEVTGLVTNDTAETVATQVASAINANSRFSATASQGIVTVVDASNETRDDATLSNGETGFTIITSQQGSSNGSAGVLGWQQANQSIDNPTAGHCLISTPAVGSDTNGVNSSASEYIGNVAEGSNGDVGDFTSVNLRVGIQFTEILPNTASDPVFSNTSATADNVTDIFPLIGNNNIKITGTTSGLSSTATVGYVDGGDLEYTISDSKIWAIGFYMIQSQYDELKEVAITHTTGSAFIKYVFPYQEIKPDCWNLLICSINNAHITNADFGDTLIQYTIAVSDHPNTAGVPDFYTSGPFTADNNSINGFQPGLYEFYHTYLYDKEKQESMPFKFIDVDSDKNYNRINIVGDSILFNFDVYINSYDSGANNYSFSKRITGSRLYYKIEENDNFYLIGELDFVNKGLKWLPEGLEMNYTMSNTSNTTGNWLSKTAIIKEISPLTANRIDTFKTINGYGASTETLNAKFKTAVVHGRRAYIGNVQQGNNNFPDRMLKSMVNKFDIFPDTVGNIDVSINDGESIIKLEAFADRILQFKENNLYIINVSENVDFLEDTLTGKGCAFDYHVTKTDYGIAWFNKFGVYFYDGRQVLNLLEKDGRRLISEDDWEAFITDGVDGNADDTDMSSAHIGYIPRSREIYIRNENSDTYCYDFLLRAWAQGSGLFFDFGQPSNFALDSDQNLIYVDRSSNKKRTLKWNPDSTNNGGTFIYATKDIDFGQPHVRKKIYKLYVSYTSDANGVVPVYYSVDGDTSLNTTAVAVSAMALSKPQWTVAEYKFNDDAKSCNSIRFQFGGATAGGAFAINDITIVYRLKNIR
jgi:hypothetical protein